MSGKTVRAGQIAVLACLLALWCGPARAQRYHVRTYTEADGLPSAEVHDIAQDELGRLWFATRVGLVSFDGARWNTTGHIFGPDTLFGHFARAPDGALWAVSALTPARLARYDGKSWRPVEPVPEPGKPNQYVMAVSILSRAGTTYLAVGLSTGRLDLFDGSSWRAVQSVEGTSPLAILDVEAVGGRFLVATPRGLMAVDPAADDLSLSAIAGVDRTVLGIGAGPAGTWLIGRNWIGLLRDDRLDLLSDQVNPGLRDHWKGVSMVVKDDGDGGVFFGNPSGLRHFSPGTGVEVLDPGSGLVSVGTTAIFRDREANLWIASLRGISKLVSRRFAGFGREQGLLTDEVSAVLERRSGEIVLGHPGGLTFFGPPRHTLSFGKTPWECRVLDLAESGDGTIWAAAAWTGLVEVSPDGTTRIHQLPDPLHPMATSVQFDDAGTLWATSGTRVYRLTDAGFSPLDLPPGEPHLTRYLRRLVAGRAGEMWVAAYSGVYRIRGDHVTLWSRSRLGRPLSVYSVLLRPDGDVWLGTGHGVYRFDGEEVSRLERPALSLDRPVYFMVEDRDRALWLGTNNGVARWDGSTLRCFTVQDGLMGSEANRAAGVLDARGRVWMGLDGGVSVHDPRLDMPRPRGPEVTVLDVSDGRERLPLDAARSFEPGDNDLVFRFRAIAFVDEDRVQFRYRLDGYDTDWQGPRMLPLRELRYTNLPAGEYRLRLQAVDVEGAASALAVSPAVQIGAWWWTRPWFRVLAAGLMLTAALLVLSNIGHRRIARRLERQVAARTTELRRSRQEVIEEKERLRAMLLSIADAVVAVDADGRIVLMNSAAEDLLGWTAAEGVGRPVEEVIAPVSRAPEGEEAESGEPILEASVRSPIPVTLRTRSGAQRIVEFAGAPIGGEGAGTVFAFRDITGRQHLERELERTRRLEALGLLAGGIAHDFNNLLTVVIGNLSIMEEAGGLPDALRVRVHQSSQASAQARVLTRQLLTFSRGGEPAREPADLTDIIRETASLVLAGSTVRAEITIDPDLWVVDIDRGQMTQVFHNLFLNACEALGDGGTIRVRGSNLDPCSQRSPAGRQVLIEVEDSGPGIAQEDLDRIFDPYFSTKDAGTGLGLATAHSVVRRHGGRLTAASRPGQGATFRVHLPASTGQIASSEEKAAPAHAARHRGRVLVVDDEPLVRDVVEALLTGRGYEVTCVSDGAAAVGVYVRALRHRLPFDLVLMDLILPGGIDGQTAAAQILEADPLARIVVASGYSQDAVMADPGRHGFCAHIVKPFDGDALARTVSDAIRPRPAPA
ncbi:MAG: ATP-binding protein [Acidobacteriota bacterium]